MSLDDERIHWREMARRDREFYDAQLKAEMDEQRACESVEAMETLWQGVMAQMPRYLRDQVWDGSTG